MFVLVYVLFALCCVYDVYAYTYVATILCSSRAEAMAAEIKELQGEMADINTVRVINKYISFLFINLKYYEVLYRCTTVVDG